MRSHLKFAALLVCIAGMFVVLAGVGSPGRPPPPPPTLVARDYTLQILRDGAVMVIEHWRVAVAPGDVHHLALNVYRGTLTSITVQPIANALHQAQVATTVANIPVETIEWFIPPAASGVITYDIAYVIAGGLGFSGATAWLDWHILSDRHMPGNGESVVTIVFPAKIAASNGDVQAYDGGAAPQVAQVDNQTERFTAAHLTGPHVPEVLVSFDRTALASALPTPPWQRQPAPPALPSLFRTVSQVDDIGPWWIIGLLLLVWAVGLVAITRSGKSTFKGRNHLERYSYSMRGGHYSPAADLSADIKSYASAYRQGRTRADRHPKKKH